jgi:hypothetical protein
MKRTIVFAVAALFALTLLSTVQAQTIPPMPPPETPVPVQPTPTPVPQRPIIWRLWMPAAANGAQPAVTGPCACTGDLYNCADFASWYEAQQCYNWCMVQGLGDPHKIDRDADGVACETNTAKEAQR